MNIEKDALLLHPIFSFKDDQYLSSILEKLTQTDNSQSPNFLQIMKDIVFQNYQDPEGLEELQQATFYTSTFCGRSANKGDICFICLDCNIFSHPDVYAIMCVECFDKSEHKGHRINRVLQEEDDAANCDCGDPQFLNPEGFCSEHQSKPINMEELYENFPSDLLTEFQIIVKKSIYAAISLLELKQENTELKNSLTTFAESFVRNMLDFWIECYSEINKAFLPILWTTLRSQLNSPWDLVLHDCQNFQSPVVVAENNTPKEPHRCTCSLVGNLFRISSLTSRGNQEKIKKILADCLKDQSFSEYLSLEFTKYLAFFFIQEYPQEFLKYEETSHHSPLLGLYVQLYADNKTLMKIIDSGYFANFLNLMKKAVDYCTRMNLIGSQIIDQIRFILDYFVMPANSCAQRLSQNQDFILQYLDLITAYQMKFYYIDGITLNLFDHEINYDSLNITLRTERSLCRPFENLTKLIEKLPQPEQKQRLTQLLQNWYMNLQNAKAVLRDENAKPCQSFDPCLERLFCCIIINYMKDDISANNLNMFIQENFNSGVNSHELAVNTIEGPLRALGMIRYLHLTFHYKSGDLFDVYYYIWNAFFEIDVVTTQMMLLLLKPEQGLFELLIKNFFSYSPEIQQFFKDPNEENYEKKLLTVIEDFLYFLVFLMTDEISLLNIQTKYKKDNFDQIDLNPRQKLVIKNLLVNILRGFYWTTGKQVKDTYRYFLSTEHEVDQVLPQITIKDEKNHRIRVKDEYESNIDPYIFYRMPSVRQDILHNFTAKSLQKSNSTDLVSGVLDKDLPQYLKEIQRNLYQGTLPEFLAKYLKTANLKTGSTLIRLVLKLILLNLQIAEEDTLESDLLRQHVKGNYVNEDIFTILENITTEDAFKDCKDCIENIKNLLQKFQGDKTMLVENSPRTQNKQDKKKLTAQERMAQLKQNFAQKQAAFAQKNQYLLQKSISFQEIGQSQKNEQLVCQHCMEKLHMSGKEYGLLIYITFTNNFYDGDNFVEQDYKNLLKADWWPVVSSCNHYFHRKCFEVFYQAPKDFEKNFLNNAYEFFCPLCKGLCNNFLSINGNEADNDLMNQEASQDRLNLYPQIYQTFTKKIQKLLVDLKAKIQLSPAGHATALEEASFVSIETIFERAYQYFTESFYLLDNPQNLEKIFNLYLTFFKGFQSYFANPENKIPEDNIQLSAFFNVNNLFLSTQASSLETLNYKTEVYLNELLAKNLQRILATSDISGKSELLALKNFILLKVIQTIAFNHSDNTLKLEDCFQLYQSNQALKSQILEQITFPIQKIILSHALNISTAPFPPLNLSELFNLLLQNSIPLQEEYLTDLFHSINIPCSFSELIQEIFHELPTRPQSEINFLSSLFDHQLFNKETLKPQLVKFSPRMIQLPETYLEFNTHYFHQKCNLCKKFSPHLYTSICLICGEVLCTGYCHNDLSQSGNLNRHAKKYHLGMGIFIDIQSLYQNLVNSPINITFEKKGLYLDDLGQDIASLIKSLDTASLAKLDFSQFKLNQELVNEFYETINLQTLRKFIFMAGLHEKDKKEDGFL